MNCSLATLATVCALLTIAESGRAAPMLFDGSLEIDFAGASLPALLVTGTGVADVVAAPASVALQSLVVQGGISASVTVPVTDPAVAPTLAAVHMYAGLGSGTLAPFQSAPPLTQDRVPISGAVRLCALMVGCGAGVDLPLSAAGQQVGVGVGGTHAFGGASLPISLAYAPWTVGTAWIPFQTASGATTFWPTFGSAHGPLSLTGSTALPGGRLQLVSPVVVESPGLAPQPIPAVARMSLRFVPEPELLWMFGSGALALILTGRRRIRPRRRS
jgi:hypothetical protein